MRPWMNSKMMTVPVWNEDSGSLKARTSICVGECGKRKGGRWPERTTISPEIYLPVQLAPLMKSI
jgi:hypothetical protein